MKPKLTLADLRKMKELLVGRQIRPVCGRYIGRSEPMLRNGIVWIGFAALHPATFLDIFGAGLFRKIKRDVSLKQINGLIKQWRADKHQATR